MGTNVEIKLRPDRFDAVAARAAELSDAPLEVLEQRDTFYACERGRLKLREERGRGAYLIAYERVDRTGLKPSRYVLTPIPEPASFKEAMARSGRALGVVAKRRSLYLHGSTRIHLDEVEGLGRFLELEVVLGPGQPVAEGEALATELLEELGAGGEWIAGSYFDLLRPTENGQTC